MKCCMLQMCLAYCLSTQFFEHDINCSEAEKISIDFQSSFKILIGTGDSNNVKALDFAKVDRSIDSGTQGALMHFVK